MKKSLAIAVGTVVVLAAGMPLAQDMKAPASNPSATAMQPGSSMNMGGQMGQMDDHMKKMQALHDRMTSATTPEERQKVMDEQRQEMQAGMGPCCGWSTNRRCMPLARKYAAAFSHADVGTTARDSPSEPQDDPSPPLPRASIEQIRVAR